MKKLILLAFAACMVVGCVETSSKDEYVNGCLFTIGEDYTPLEKHTYKIHHPYCPNPMHKDTCKCK